MGVKPNVGAESRFESTMHSPPRCFLFLDVDGVMIPFGKKEIARGCALSLRQIVAAVPRLRIVLTSSWRAPPLERFFRVWRRAELPESWIEAMTPDLSRDPANIPEMRRGLEIRRWLAQHGEAGARFAILDDQPDEISPCFPSEIIFRTDPMSGLDRKTAKQIITLLQKTGSGPRAGA